MNSPKSLSLRMGLVAGIIVFGIAVVWAGGQAAAPQAGAQPTADQQKQLDQLKQLDEQLQKDRDALHQAITQHGWDSDQVDSAQENLFRDREQYRKLRRSLRAAGVAVPEPSGFGPGMGGPGPGGRKGQGRAGGPHGYCPYMPDCPCAGR